MKTTLIRTTLLSMAGALIAAVSLPAASLPVTFSGADAFGASADGNYQSGITSTNCCQSIDIEEGTFTGDPANYISLPFALTPGDYTFYLETGDWSTAYGVTTGGLNLFFNGDTPPGISASVTPSADGADLTTNFTVNSASSTPDFNSVLGPASGSLSFTSGDSTVTLTGFQWVAGGATNTYSPSLTVQRIDLSVEGDTIAEAPEPGTLLLLGSGFGLLCLVRRKV